MNDRSDTDYTYRLDPAGWDREGLGDDARRALGHIGGRTVTGGFASQLWDMPKDPWESALGELRDAGYDIRWTYGTVADDPSVLGGYVVVDGPRTGKEPTTRESWEVEIDDAAETAATVMSAWLRAGDQPAINTRERDPRDQGLGAGLEMEL